MKTTSNLASPTFPSSLWDFVPFLCAGLLALLFTALLVLLVEDAEDREIQYASVRNTTRITTKESLPSTRLVGHAEKPWADGLKPGTELQVGGVPLMIHPGLSYHHPQQQQQQQQQRLLAKQLSNRNDIAVLLKQYRPSANLNSNYKGLLASASSNHSAPILSMAKMIMHRHDQANKRPRRSKPGQPSPPPSPPAIQTQTTSFQQLQYTPPMILRRSPPPSPTSPPLSPPPFPYQRPRIQAHARTPSVTHIQTHHYVPLSQPNLRAQPVC